MQLVEDLASFSVPEKESFWIITYQNPADDDILEQLAGQGFSSEEIVKEGILGDELVFFYRLEKLLP